MTQTPLNRNTVFGAEIIGGSFKNVILLLDYVSHDMRVIL